MADFDHNPRGGLTANPDSLHASDGYKRQFEAAQRLPKADTTNSPEIASNLVAPTADLDTIALAAANDIALMRGQNRSQLVSKIQVRVLDALREASPRAMRRQIDTLVEEVREAADLRERMGTILTDVADALKGPRPAGGLHSWHDLAAVARHAVADRDAALARVDTAPVAIMDTRDVLGLCAPAEKDFPALYALQGQRVALVKLPPTADSDNATLSPEDC